MSNEFLYHANLFLIFSVVIVLLGVSVELGYRRGRGAPEPFDGISESLLELIPTSLLGLLALLLGFTFSMAIHRFDARKQAMLRETNAIETSYLRAGLLPPGEIAPARQALKLYLKHRIALSSDHFISYNERTKRLQYDVWEFAKKNSLARRDVTSSLFTGSVNDMIDIGGEREFATDDHVPELVYLGIFGIMISCMFLLSSIYGCRGRTRVPPLFVACLLGSVLVLIEDLDRPAGGLIRISSAPLLQLENQLDKG